MPLPFALRVRSPLARPAALIALMAAGLLAGCSDDKSSKPAGPAPPEGPDLSTPAATLIALRTAYEERDPATYAMLFEDDFVFAFSPEAVAYRSDMQAEWELSAELAAAGAMFRDDRVDKITLSFEYSVPDSSDDVLPGTVRVRMEQVRLSVFVEIDGVPWEWRVSGDDGDFYFRRSEANGRPRWRIVRWDDEPAPAPRLRTSPGSLKEASWGEIKWLYAPADLVRPAAVRSLHVTGVTESAVTLAWEAVGDDSLHGRAREYDLRYSEAEITNESWWAAFRAIVPGLPQPSGSAETFTAQGLQSERTYHFVLKVIDERGQASALSNPVSATTGPAPRLMSSRAHARP